MKLAQAFIFSALKTTVEVSKRNGQRKEESLLTMEVMYNAIDKPKH
jgi:hypothetical protein